MSKLIKEPYGMVGVYSFVCPGCGDTHYINTNNYNTYAKWNFNSDLNKPTFQPSILVRTGKYVPGFDNFREPDEFNLSYICHSFVTDGKIRFLTDSTHQLSGKTIELPEVDDRETQISSATANGGEDEIQLCDDVDESE